MERMIDYFYDTRNTLGLAWRSWVEATVIMFLALLACFVLHPYDPFFIDGPYPWITLALMIIALQYSIGPSLLALCMLLTAFTYHYTWGALSIHSYQLFLFGMAMVTLIANQYKSSWFNRIRQASATSFYTRERIHRLLNDFYMLRYSHDCLEQTVMLQPITMRDALQDISRLSLNLKGEITSEVATPLIQLLASHFGFTKAQIRLFNDGQFDKTSIYSLGEPAAFDAGDILVKRVVTEKKAQYFAANQFEKESHSQYLAALPLCNSDESLVGILCIEDMPFLALNHENLTIMSVLLNYFADEVNAIHASLGIIKDHPDCCPQLARSLLKLQRLYKSIAIESSIVCFHIDDIEQRDEIIRLFCKQQRGLDETWEIKGQKPGDTTVFAVLMPFTDLKGVSAYLKHRRTVLEKEFHLEIGEMSDNNAVRVIYHPIRFQNLNDLYNEMVVTHAP